MKQPVAFRTFDAALTAAQVARTPCAPKTVDMLRGSYPMLSGGIRESGRDYSGNGLNLSEAGTPANTDRAACGMGCANSAAAVGGGGWQQHCTEPPTQRAPTSIAAAALDGSPPLAANSAGATLTADATLSVSTTYTLTANAAGATSTQDATLNVARPLTAASAGATATATPPAGGGQGL